MRWTSFVYSGLFFDQILESGVATKYHQRLGGAVVELRGAPLRSRH